MTNNFHSAEAHLIELLSQTHLKVICLKGKWGTGKTYLWGKVSTQFSQAQEKPIFISLFGAKDINEVKLKLLESTYAASSSKMRNTIETVLSASKDVMSKFFGISTQNMSLLWISNFITNKLVVIDDVERKHKNLDIDELLGFFDEHTEKSKTRFLILINVDKLEQKDIWEKLHEKVIDAEIVLDPTPADAFGISIPDVNFPLRDEIKKAILSLNINNIRIIKKIHNVIAYIMNKVPMYKEIEPARWIPSTVLLTAIHYRALENPPTYDYLLKINSYKLMSGKKDENRDPNEIEWDSLFEKLGISYFDEFEPILKDYLDSGILDVQKLDYLFSQHKKNSSKELAVQKVRNLYTALLWDQNASNEQLLNDAKFFLDSIVDLEANDVTDLVSITQDLGDASLARALLDKWLASIDTNPAYQEIEERIFDDIASKFHPEITAKLNSMRDKQHPPLTINEAITRIRENSGWGDRERIAMKNSTVKQYHSEIGNLVNDDLRRFFETHIRWVKNCPDEHFINGIKNFVQACKEICEANPNKRFTETIKNSFNKYGLGNILDTPADKTSPPQQS